MLNELTANGRVWIHAANRPLNPTESQAIKDMFEEFTSAWTAHGKSLKASFQIFYDQILVLGVDEDFEQATGCSIDTAIQVFRTVDETYKLDLFNRLNMTFVKEDKILLLPMFELNNAYQDKRIDDQTEFLDNSIASVADFQSKWKVAFKASWAFKKVKQLA